jgi:hypothetical protein
MTTGLWNTGSVVNHVGGLVGWTNIPTSVSGTTLNNMCEQEINFIELYSSDSIDSNAVPEKYQPALCDLLTSKVLLTIQTQRGGIDSAKLGELSVSAGTGGISDLATQLRTDAISRLKELMRKLRFKRVIGGV